MLQFYAGLAYAAIVFCRIRQLEGCSLSTHRYSAIFFHGTLEAYLMYERNHEGGPSMKWLEIIKLRSAGIGEDSLEEFLRSLTESSLAGGLMAIRIYRHAGLESDAAVHLHWESKGPARNGTDVAIRLAEALKQFGLVDHSVWIEEQGTVGAANKRMTKGGAPGHERRKA
jgi:hypothetical protein